MAPPDSYALTVAMLSSIAVADQPGDESPIRRPPSGILGSFRFMGPGLLLSASIVGSGELIATTTLGARAGFVLLWVILFGCLVKVAVQLEFGRFCIVHGLPTFQAWNRIGRSRLGPLHWTVWAGVLYMISILGGQAGVLGGAAQVGAYAVQAVPLALWVAGLAILIGLLQFRGRYGPVEAIAAGLNLLFVSAVVYCVFALQGTSFAFGLADLRSGLSFHLPGELLPLAVAAFGITGIASGEIAMYPYWCMEKGYAAWTGPRDDSPEWAARAKGWIRVMTVDAVFSMVVYTVTTAAFYVLGAAVLRSQAELADGNRFILQLSAIFTDVLGDEARWIFMLCAFSVLFSTIFANTAAFSRLWTDVFGLWGWIDWENPAGRRRSIARVAWVFPGICGVVYLLVQRPLFLIVLMGIANALFLIVVAYQAVVFRYRHTDPRLVPGVVYDVALWLSIASICLLACHAAYSLFYG